jgi:hypothetical protein
MKQYVVFLKEYNLSDIVEPYDLTIAITENFFMSDILGLIYPSVAHKFKSANFVLQPEYFRDILKPTAIEIYDNFVLLDNCSVGTRLLSIGSFDDCGNISWTDPTSEERIKWE